MDARKVADRVRWWVSLLGPLISLAVFVPLTTWAARREVAHCVGTVRSGGLVWHHHGLFLGVALLAALPTAAAVAATRGNVRWPLVLLVVLALVVGLAGEWVIGQGDCWQPFTF